MKRKKNPTKQKVVNRKNRDQIGFFTQFYLPISFSRFILVGLAYRELSCANHYRALSYGRKKSN